MSLRSHKVGQNRYCEIFMSTLIGWCEYIFAEIMISAINNKLLYLVCIIHLHCEPKHIYGLESVVAMELRLSCTNPSICCLHLAALAIYNNYWLWHVQPNNPHAWLSSLQFVTLLTWKHFPRYWPLRRNSPVPGEFPAQRPVTRSFDVFFDLGLNKRLRKQSWGWWFETPSRPLRRHCNACW